MNDENVISLGAHREPVTYTVRFRQSYDGSLTVWVQDVADNPRSRQAVADALRRAAQMIEDQMQ